MIMITSLARVDIVVDNVNDNLTCQGQPVGVDNDNDQGGPGC